MQIDALEHQLANILLLLEAGNDSGGLNSQFGTAFALVPHKNEFLPTFAIRYIAQDDTFAELDDATRLKLHDQASTAMLDWLAWSATDKSHPKRSCLAPGVPLQFYAAAFEALSDLRALDSKQDLCFRLIQIAGNSVQEASDLLRQPSDEVKGCWLTARAFVEDHLERLEEPFDLSLFDEAGLRPPAEVTRTLEQIRKRDSALWEVAENQEGIRQIKQTARRVIQRQGDVDSIVQESLLRMALPSGPIPENSRRLQHYVSRIMSNLARDRYKRNSKLVHPEDNLVERTPAGKNPHPDEEVRQSVFRDTLTKLLGQLDRDKPQVFNALETWLLSMPNASDSERAERLGISTATFKRRKDEVQTFIEAGFKEVGLNLGHYKNFSRPQRLENLYQLIYPILVEEMGVVKGRDYRSDMSAALELMERACSPLYNVLRDCYLGPSVKPSSLAERLRITPTELTRRKLEAKTELARKIVALVRESD